MYNAFVKKDFKYPWAVSTLQLMVGLLYAFPLWGFKLREMPKITKDDLMKSKSGKIVTKKSNAAGKKAYKRIAGWNAAVAKARKALGCKGFVAIKKGSALYNKAKGFYGKGSPKK